MVKNIIKEIIIMLLLCLAIILILGILLYEYVPSSKIIPEQVSYITPEDVKEELSKTENVDSENPVLTYSIDSTTLNNYQKINTYVPGKSDPFASYDSTQSSGTENNQNSGTTTKNNNTISSGNSNKTNSSSSNSGNSTNSTSTNTSTGYLPDKGTK